MRVVEQDLCAQELAFEEMEEQYKQMKLELEAARVYAAGLRRRIEEADPDAVDISQMSVRDGIAQVLKDGALHRDKVLERVLAMGIHVGGEDPMNNLAAHLSKDKRFTTTGKRGIWKLVSPHRKAESRHLGSNGVIDLSAFQIESSEG